MRSVVHVRQWFCSALPTLRSCAWTSGLALVMHRERLIMKGKGARRSAPTGGLLCAELFTSANGAEMIVK